MDCTESSLSPPSFRPVLPLTRPLQDWCEAKAFQDADTVSEDKLCLFLNTEVIGRESRARGYLKRRKKKLDDRRARIERCEKKKSARIDNETAFLPAERFRDSQDSDIEEYDTDPEFDTDADADENTLFKETVGFSVVESYINGVTEFWKE
jgi:hypothetical protein